MAKAIMELSGADRRGQASPVLVILLIAILLALIVLIVVVARIPAVGVVSNDQGQEARGLRKKIEVARNAIGPNANLSQAIKLFKVNTGVYPEELKYLLEKPSNDDVARKWRGPYIDPENDPKDPWDHDYQYNANGHHNKGKFDLWSKGPDGKNGTNDDIVNW